MIFAVLSGFLTGLLFVFPEFYMFSFFSVIPFIISLEKSKNIFKSGFLYGFFLNLTITSFLLSMHPLDFIGIDGFKSLVIVILAYLGVCLLEGIISGLLFGFFEKFIKNIWLFPVFYAIYEILISLGPTGFTFTHLYLIFYNNLEFIQSASVFSCYFITLLVVFINLLIYKSLSKKPLYLILAVLIFLINSIYGRIILQSTFEYRLPKEKVTLIQGNITSHEKWANSSMYKIMDTYKSLTLEAHRKEKAEIFIWPETVVPVGIDCEHNIYREMSEFAKENGFYIITGAFIKENENIYNCIISFDKNGNQSMKPYKKRHLIPFSESNISKGYEGTVSKTPLGKAGSLICIDSAYPSLAFSTRLGNPDFFIVVSNDSWFENSHLSRLHNAHSIFRAIESRRYVLRCANTGITNIISPLGKIEKSLPEGQKGYITYEK